MSVNDERRDASHDRQDYAELAEKMQSGLDIRTRRRKLRRHTDCFKGSDAVDWLAKTSTDSNRAAAARLAFDMHKSGLIKDVGRNTPFSDNPKSLYRFSNVPMSSDDASTSASIITTPRRQQSMEAERFINQLDSSWAQKVAIGRGPDEETKDSLKKRISQLEAEVIALAAAVKNHAEMSEILVESLSGEIRCLQSSLLSSNARNSQASSDAASKSWMRTLAVWTATSLISILVIQTQQGTALQSLLCTAVCLLGTVISFHSAWISANIPWITAAQSPRLNCDKGGHVADASLESPISPHSYTDLLARIQSLPRASMSESSCSDSDGGARFHSLRASKLSWEEDAPESHKSQINIAFENEPRQRAGEEGRAGQGPDSHALNDQTEQAADREPCGTSAHPTRTASREGNTEFRAGPPNAEDFSRCPDSPILIKPRDIDGQICFNLVDGSVPINNGRKLEFETPLFRGCVVIWIKGLPSSPADLFSGKQRRTALTIQGRFKKDVSLNSLCTGQEFFKPAENLPAKWLVESVLIKIARSISPSMSIGPMSAPYVLVPIVAGAQLINVASPGEEPDCRDVEIPEDMSLFDSQLTSKKGVALSASRRQKHFWNSQNRSKTFSKEHVWTFSIYQSQVDMSQYRLDVGLKFDLCRHLNGQPMQFMMRDRDTGEYLCNFEAWHKKLIPGLEKADD